MATNTIIRGTDGAVPQYDANARWTTWNLKEIYLGDEAHNRFVPKIEDYVVDTVNRKTYIVTAISDLLIPTLQDADSLDGDVLEEDLLLGVASGRQSETYRCYVDTSTVPTTLSVDSRVLIGGSMSTYARIFRGTSVSDTAEVVSVVYDQGNYLDDKVLLELAAYDSHDINNLSIKVVPPCNTNKHIQDGELLTLVIYSSTGSVIYKKTLLAENTSFVRTVNQDQKYVSHLSITTPFLDPTNTQVIRYPINVPVASLNIYGNVHYSDGSIRTLPVDGSKFRLLGLESFVATIVGQEVDLVLRYQLDHDESTYGSVTVDGRHLAEPYKLITDVENGVYTPKVYVYPEWNRATEEYELRYWLMDLRRDVLLDVTQHVYLNDSSTVWNGADYQVRQDLSFRINLNDVSAAFPVYIHTQTTSVTLRNTFSQPGTKFEIGFEPNQTNLYGTGLVAKTQMTNQNLWKLNLGNQITNLNEWLERLYYQTKPVYSLRRELKPLTPSHFAILVGDLRFEFGLDKWNTDITISTNLDLHTSVYVEFLLDVGSGPKLKLSIGALVLEPK